MRPTYQQYLSIKKGILKSVHKGRGYVVTYIKKPPEKLSTSFRKLLAVNPFYTINFIVDKVYVFKGPNARHLNKTHNLYITSQA